MKKLILFVLIGRVFAQVSAVQNPVPGANSSVNTLNPSIQVQGPYASSVPDTGPSSGVLALSLRDAIQRAKRANLSGIQFQAALREARGQATVRRSALLPNVSADLREVLTKTNLRAFGVRFPGAPTVVGPFNYFDLRATLTQVLFDHSAKTGYKAAQELVTASVHRMNDAKDVVVLAVSGAYLQALAADARVQSMRAQVDTAKTLFSQASQQNKEGLLAVIDVNRSEVELQTQQQRLITLENDYAKLKLNLARIIGLPSGQQFSLADKMPFQADTVIDMNQALAAAMADRADLHAAQAFTKAAELQVGSARAQRLPSLSVSADYGAIGTNPSQSAGTYTLVGNLRVPIWAGGRVQGEVEQAAAELEQRRAQLADLRGQIDAEIRSAFLDIESAASQSRVAEGNLKVSRHSLELTRQRFEAGIADTAEVSRAQAGVASAEQDMITSHFAHSLAKAVLARSVGKTEEWMIKMLAVP
jgi:outer membrane protein TolC